MQAELWFDSRPMNHFEILGGLVRSELEKEKVRRIDLSYLGARIDHWWAHRDEASTALAPSAQLEALIAAELRPEHRLILCSIGHDSSKVAAVLFEHAFSTVNKALARLVHEVFAKLGGLIDINYPYEEHKELYPKVTGGTSSDWGKGYGMIRPHSDDLYEDRDINIMSLTVCKDTSQTPTWFWPLKDVVACLNDEELGRLASAEATYYSGTNVEGISISKTKPVLRRDRIEGVGLRLDFRIDDSVGPRMRFADESIQSIVTRLRMGLRTIRPIENNPSVGSISILSNFKVLHGRSALNPVMLSEGESSRILFRSKGIKQEAL